MSEPVQRRSLLKLAAGTAATGWLWQTGVAQAAETGAAETDAAETRPGPLDTLVLGDTTSETAHALTATRSDTVTGGLGQPARVLNPAETKGFWGGRLAATLACRPRGATYVTIKLWGSEKGEDLGRLQLFAEGKQVGHFHLGAVDPLDIAGADPRTPYRFYFHTLPLPPELTAGKRSVDLEIRAMGQVAGYALTAADYFKDMTGPSRTVYRLYTHDQPYFAPDPDDITGTLPAPAKRPSPGNEVVQKINARVLAQAAAEASRTVPQLDLWYLEFLARAYRMPATGAYRESAVPGQIASSLDAIYWQHLSDANVVINSSQQWMGLGRAGLVMLALADELEPLLDEFVIGSPGVIANAGFEHGTDTPQSWTVPGWGKTADASWSRDTTVARRDGASLKVQASQSGGFITVYSTPKTKIGKGRYTYGAWVRTDGVTGAGAHIDPLFFDADGKLIGSDHRQYATTGTHDWEYVSLDLDTPDGATRTELHLRLSGPGTVWFDDVTLVAPAGSADAPVVRRVAWAKMLLDSREYWRQNFPQYTNQAVICALGLYLADRGLTWLGAETAWGETKARGYLRQSVGLAPWLGPEDKDGNPTKPLGGAYYQVSRKGVSKELGYAGNYGELQDWLALVHDAVIGIGGVKDTELHDHLVKMVKARAVFHYPALDSDGYTAMRYEAVVGWRDGGYPGKVAYDEGNKWDGHPMRLATLLKDPDLTSYARQSVADNQVFQVLQEAYDLGASARTNLQLLSTADDYAYVTGSTGGGAPLPMTPGQPDFVFSDEENGLVAVKHGDEILYASLYWRARWGVNRLARVHLITAEGIEWSATVWQDVRHDPDGRSFTEPDWINWEFTTPDLPVPAGGYNPPGDVPHQAFAGQVLPLAAAPADAPRTAPGQESPFAGRASFYRCAYGQYLIAMNTTADRTCTFSTKGFGAARNLLTGAKVTGNATLSVRPGSTVVLRKR
ncbi:Tat pathway signal protein [Streptomyces diastatochromogenes]|uniref:Tat pathway signal protein n=1 Tax=Streptomyces diastatochromogenes TaxID=42236 RepID=UPI0036D0508E